ncbi:unnamed protein product [Albugo candida]|uniref:Uncharacterized protein n=1 Tax=Albugo candida TaxID=65357 RepID=A0A024G7A3_9STRA|nr:unnamed protein product [Albugo candida]|eukprot:CCI42544.1 unnamed protein product [Albugo candida]
MDFIGRKKSTLPESTSGSFHPATHCKINTIYEFRLKLWCDYSCLPLRTALRSHRESECERSLFALSSHLLPISTISFASARVSMVVARLSVSDMTFAILFLSYSKCMPSFR